MSPKWYTQFMDCTIASRSTVRTCVISKEIYFTKKKEECSTQVTEKPVISLFSGGNITNPYEIQPISQRIKSGCKHFKHGLDYKCNNKKDS